MVNKNFLKNVPLFTQLTENELDKLTAYFTVIKKNSNDIIFKKGEKGQAIYIIESGSVDITMQNITGESYIAFTLHAGDFFGELTLFDESERTASAIAHEETLLLEMPRHKFILFLKSHPEVSISLLTLLVKRLRRTDEIMDQQITKNVNEEIELESSFGDKLADRFSNFIGSWTFILIFFTLLISWISLNFYAFIFRPVDPYPFTLLNLILSCLAAFQAPVIMMSQGRQSAKDRITADLDYKINLKAELQIQEIRMEIVRLRKNQQVQFKKITTLQKELLAKQEKN